MITRSGRHQQALGLLVASVFPFLGAVSTGLVQVSRCLPVSGRLGEVGVHVALLRPDAACAGGGLAVGGETERMLVVALAVSGPALLGVLALLAGSVVAAGALASVRRWLEMLVPWRRVPRLVAVHVRSLSGAVRGVVQVLDGSPERVPHRRGPPLTATA